MLAAAVVSGIGLKKSPLGKMYNDYYRFWLCAEIAANCQKCAKNVVYGVF